MFIITGTRLDYHIYIPGIIMSRLPKGKSTPYMHIMAYHVPRLMMLHKGITKFSGQGKLLKTRVGNKFWNPVALLSSGCTIIYTVWLTDDWNLNFEDCDTD